MRLHVNPHCITIHIPEDSLHLTKVNQTLCESFSKTFWVNETLINLASDKEAKERKAFLTSLYYTCAYESRTHNGAFLEKLIALHDKPIKVVKKTRTSKTPFPLHANAIESDYRLLGLSPFESLASIRKKYLRLAKKYHPDTLEPSLRAHPLYAQKFQHIHEAYERIKAQRKESLAA